MADDKLFDLLPAAPATKPAPKTAWTRITTHRACDWCAKTLARAGGEGPRPDVARWRHAGPAGVTLLCYQHARDVRAGENEAP